MKLEEIEIDKMYYIEFNYSGDNKFSGVVNVIKIETDDNPLEAYVYCQIKKIDYSTSWELENKIYIAPVRFKKEVSIENHPEYFI